MYKQLAEHAEPIYVFSDNPFWERQAWLKMLALHVLDPEDKTTAALEKLEIPFTCGANVVAIEEWAEGTLIVG